MTLALFVTLVSLFALAVSLITEAVKKFLQDTGVKYSANIVVLILSVVVGVGGTALVYLFMGIPYTPPNIVCMVLMAVSVWVGSMVGYDKVIQMLDQLKNLKLK